MDSGLEQFLLLAKSARNRACVALITQVLNHRKIYALGELLDMENVQALRGSEFEPHLRLLELFAYGTYSDYRAAADLPELSEAMRAKLRKLTIVSLAQRRRVVPYAALREQLELSSTREVEDVVIDAIYSGLIRGRLDQRAEALLVSYAQARDQRPQDVDEMIGTLERWCESASAVSHSAQDTMGFMTAHFEADAKRAGDANARVAKSRDNFLKQVEREGGIDMVSAGSRGGGDRSGRSRRRMMGLFEGRRGRG